VWQQLRDLLDYTSENASLDSVEAVSGATTPEDQELDAAWHANLPAQHGSNLVACIQ
jgi:major membrane immunogen (membrane-anchored lipoprotein)